MLESMLTTIDNPYDPFDSYDEWFAWDARHGYHTPGLLARVTATSSELSDVDQSLAIDKAIEEIISINASGVHTKVEREIPESVDVVKS